MDQFNTCPQCKQSLKNHGKFWICPEHGQVLEDKTFKPLRIFLSYGHDDNEELVCAIYRDLKGRGHDVWIDKAKIKNGDDWRREITDGIISSQRIISFLSRHSTRDPGVCLDEIGIAIGARGGTIQTILVESENDVKPPSSISHIQWLDMHDWKERKSEGEVSWNRWYTAKLEEIARVVECDESRYFAGEIHSLEEYLKPISYSSRISHLIRKKIVGRKWIEDAIEDWRKNDRSSRIFLIIGDPGVGKSAFSAYLTHYAPEKIIAVQFCEYDKPDHRDPHRIIRTIAFQIATRLPDYRKLLLSLPEIGVLDRKSPSELFDYLLSNPLVLVIDGGRERYLIIIDALDEARNTEGNELAEMLSRNASRLPDWIGVVITSRPETDVLLPLQGITPYILDPKKDNNRTDIRAYLQDELKPYLSQHHDADQLIDQIIEKSEGVFLYIERFCEDIRGGNLSLDSPEKFPRGLGESFFQAFRRQFPDIVFFRKEIRPSLRLILASCGSLPVDYLKRENWSEEDLNDHLSSMGSLFTVTADGKSRTIKPFHRSISEWLSSRSSAGGYYISISEGHRSLARLGLDEYRQGMASMSPYMVNNLPWHLVESGMDEKIIMILSDFTYLERSWASSPFTIRRAFICLENNNKGTIQKIVSRCLATPQDYSEQILSLWIVILEQLSFYADAEFLLKHLIMRIIRQTTQYATIKPYLYNLQWLLVQQGKYDEFFNFFKQFNINISYLVDPLSYLEFLSLKVSSRAYQFQLKTAYQCLLEMYLIANEQKNVPAMETSLGALAPLLYYIGGDENYLTALRLLSHRENLNRKEAKMDALATDLNHLGLVLLKLGFYTESLKKFEESDTIVAEIGDRNTRQLLLGNRALVHEIQGKIDEALELLRIQEEICQNGMNDSLQRCYSQQSDLHFAKKNYELSLEYSKKQEDLCKKLKNLNFLSTVLERKRMLMKVIRQTDGLTDLEGEIKEVNEERVSQNSKGASDGSASDISDEFPLIVVSVEDTVSPSVNEVVTTSIRKLLDDLKLEGVSGSDVSVIRINPPEISASESSEWKTAFYPIMSNSIGGIINIIISNEGLWDSDTTPPRYRFASLVAYRTAVLSLKRFEGSDPHLMNERLMKLSYRTVGIPLSIICKDPSCYLSYHSGFEDLDNNSRICPACMNTMREKIRSLAKQRTAIITESFRQISGSQKYQSFESLYRRIMEIQRLETQNNYSDAIGRCSALIDDAPWYESAYLARARLVLGQDDRATNLDQVISDCTTVLRTLPGSSPGHYYRGRAYARKGEFKKAIHDYECGILLKPTDLLLHLNLMESYICASRYPEAIALFKTYLEDYDNVANRLIAETMLKIACALSGENYSLKQSYLDDKSITLNSWCTREIDEHLKILQENGTAAEAVAEALAIQDCFKEHFT